MNQELEKVINAIKTLISRNFIGYVHIDLEKTVIVNHTDFEEIRKAFGLPEFCVLDSVSFMGGSWKWYILDTYVNSVSLKIEYEYNEGKVKIKKIELTSYPKR